MAREACAAHPPTSREPTPVRGVALVLGGQNPITLEYQIYPPPIDTLVTGMGGAALFSAGRTSLITYVAVQCKSNSNINNSNRKCFATPVVLHFSAVSALHGVVESR